MKEKIPVYLDQEQIKIFLELIDKVIEEQEQIRSESVKKITDYFALANALQNKKSQSD